MLLINQIKRRQIRRVAAEFVREYPFPPANPHATLVDFCLNKIAEARKTSLKLVEVEFWKLVLAGLSQPHFVEKLLHEVEKLNGGEAR